MSIETQETGDMALANEMNEMLDETITQKAQDAIQETGFYDVLFKVSVEKSERAEAKTDALAESVDEWLELWGDDLCEQNQELFAILNALCSAAGLDLAKVQELA